jgi:hypothetical protein
MPFPMNKLYIEMHVYSGKMYTTSIGTQSTQPPTQHFPDCVLLRADRLKWVTMRTCIKRAEEIRI